MNEAACDRIADSYEGAIVGLTVANLGLTQADEVFMVTHDSVHVAKSFFDLFGIDMGKDLDFVSSLPARTRFVLAPDAADGRSPDQPDGAYLALREIRPLGWTESQRVRKLVGGRVTEPLARISTQWVKSNGEIVPSSYLVRGLPDGRWAGKQRKEGLWAEYAALYTAAFSLLWTIRMSLPDSPGVVIASTPERIYDLLRPRDLPAGATRRQALRHWVRAHQRTSRLNPEQMIEVRRYLRGTEICRWFGIDCVIREGRSDGPCFTKMLKKQ